MRIEGPIPINVARAYGVLAPARPTPPHAVETAPPVTSSPAPAPSNKIELLIAGHVGVPVDFSTAASPIARGALQLYTRAADRMEAAVAVQIGRSLDVRG